MKCCENCLNGYDSGFFEITCELDSEEYSYDYCCEKYVENVEG